MQGDTRGVHNCTNSSCVASPSMVPNPAEVPGGVPSVATQTLFVANWLHLLLKRGQLQLAVWKVSGNVIQQKAFQAGLPNSSWQGGARPPIQLTSHHGSGGIAGVLEERLIPFCDMSDSFWIS